MSELPTPRDYLGVHTVYAFSAPCNRHRQLDLAAMIAAGHGDTPLVKLPLTCSQCDKSGHSITVEGRSYPNASASLRD
jgi:hypothetical protein